MKDISKKVAKLFIKNNTSAAKKAQELEYKIAISALKDYTDRELDDIGISRYEIENVVRFGFAANDARYSQNTAA